jgi:hypothetical protein
MEQSAEGATVFCEVPKYINGSLNITAIHISTLLYFSSLKIICGDLARKVEISNNHGSKPVHKLVGSLKFQLQLLVLLETTLNINKLLTQKNEGSRLNSGRPCLGKVA